MRDFAVACSKMSACSRGTQVGAIVVPLDFSAVLAMGYNGPAAGLPHSYCNGKPGACGCAHAEANALVKLHSREPSLLICTHSPCMYCAPLIVNTRSIKAFVYGEAYRDAGGLQLLRDAGVYCIDWKDDSYFNRTYAKLQERWTLGAARW